MRGAVQLQSATGKKVAGRTVGGPCGCHKSKPCNSFKYRCRQANQPCTVDCKCYNHVCFFNKELVSLVRDTGQPLLQSR